eukprot:6198714-Pleurochrysis_carterae.AAC.3
MREQRTNSIRWPYPRALGLSSLHVLVVTLAKPNPNQCQPRSLVGPSAYGSNYRLVLCTWAM